MDRRKAGEVTDPPSSKTYLSLEFGIVSIPELTAELPPSVRLVSIRRQNMSPNSKKWAFSSFMRRPMLASLLLQHYLLAGKAFL